MHLQSDPLDLLHLPGVGGNPAAALHDQQNWRGGDHHHTLPVLSGPVPGPLHLQLGVALLFRRLLRYDRHRGWTGTDYPVL